MNKTIMIIGIIFLIGIASAGIISISTWEKDITLDKTTTDKIKEVSNVSIINVEIGKIQCDEKECWATLFQKDLIQTNWRRAKTYCSEWNETIWNETEEINPEIDRCLEYTEYTLEENKQAIQDYLEKRLGDWALVEEARQDRIIEDKTDIGTIKEKEISIIK